MKITISEEEFADWYSVEWEKSVIIKCWEHNFEEKKYIIEYIEKI